MAMRLAAINTLGVFSSLAQHFVVIAPDSVHKDTGKPVNKASYQRRGWCRLEQWGHMCVSGMKARSRASCHSSIRMLSAYYCSHIYAR